MKKVIQIFTIAALGGITALGLNKWLFKPDQPAMVQQTGQQPIKYVNLGNTPESTVNFVAAAEASVHAVVHIKTMYSIETFPTNYNDPFAWFFGTPRPQTMPQGSQGSGVIVSPDGYIVTNNHVIDKAEKIEVILNDKRSFQAELIGKDPTTDIALLKIKETNLPYLAYGNSDEVRVGEWVLAVGNPFNLTSTVTAGIVSAKGRNINVIENDPTRGIFPIESFIQTDAAINPGNSGGAMVNSAGQLVGINTAIASQTGSYSGYGFAVPINIAKKVVSDLLEFGEVQRAFLGVSIRDIDSKLANEKNIKSTQGIFVQGISTNSAAGDAGIQEGDVILKINNVAVNNVPELQEQIGKYRPGDKVNVLVMRDNEEKMLSVHLKNKNGDMSIIEKTKIDVSPFLGATFEQLNEQERKKLNLEGGLRIAQLGNGKLRNAGVKDGFIITGVDKKKINSKEELEEVLKNKKGGVLIEGVYPNGMKAYYGFGI